MNKSKKQNNLKLLLFNANGIKSKLSEFKFYCEEQKPDIIFLNEIKMNQENANFFLKMSNFQTFEKVRNNQGGGVAILVKNEIQVSLENFFDHLKIEIICLKIKNTQKNKEMLFITYYNPPNSTKRQNQLNIEVFKILYEKKAFHYGGGFKCLL